jgi:hypothetical protein
VAEKGQNIGSRIAERVNVLTREIDAVDTTKGTVAVQDAHLAAINALLGMVGELADEVDRLSTEIDSLKGHTHPSQG